jgi:hypothetical protein
MPKPNLTLQGEMSVQPLEHGSTAASPSLPAMPIPDRKSKAPASPKKRWKDDSLAKANEVTRRNSLRKQRRAMKV